LALELHVSLVRMDTGGSLACNDPDPIYRHRARDSRVRRLYL